MIKFKGFSFRYTEQDGVYVLYLSTKPVVAKDFLGEEIEVDGQVYRVYEVTDPYRPPYVGRGHKNAGKFAELRALPKGESIPNPYDTNASARVGQSLYTKPKGKD